ncbi:uncharacterized protein N7458_003167 [Penicillium daleae]|uniref:Uncharacterized protein n=1 Tax=Penicillium daleae TaxID=63821 RepID=A0AAD6CH44_9EURO|nr:uncharacterized protein N7458_003167 [Penicillium daleae]KAJ5461615.1 hypothetical protein N7458_003167 [Penicillium daleae]
MVFSAFWQIAILLIESKGVAAQTTEVGVLQPVKDFWNPFVGSVVATNGSLTTIEVNCLASSATSCPTYVALPYYLTIGPSTQGLYGWTTALPYTESSVVYYAKSMTQQCEITSITQGASCKTTESEFWSGGDTTTRSSWAITSSTPADRLTMATLTVNGGLQLLQSPISSPIPTMITTTTHGGQTNSLPTAATMMSQEESSSKAWIAGPILGAFAGVSFIIGMVIWHIKRKTSTRTVENVQAGPLDMTQEKPPSLPEYKAELPAHDLKRLDPVELPGDGIYEAPGVRSETV